MQIHSALTSTAIEIPPSSHQHLVQPIPLHDLVPAMQHAGAGRVSRLCTRAEDRR